MLVSTPEIGNAEPSLVAAGIHASLTDRFIDRSWFAISVYPRHEKQVAEMCRLRGVDYLLPLYSSLRRWRDRRKLLEMVLFPGYVFVRIALSERLRVLVLPGVARFVCFQGRPAVVPERQLQALGAGAQGVSLLPHPYLKKGCLVRVRSGPMAGIEGILVRRKDRFRVVISIDLIQRSIAAEVDEGDIEPLA